MNNIVRFDDYARELNKESLEHREIRAETNAAIVLTVKTYKDGFPEEWQHLSRRVTAQFNSWIKSDSAPAKQEFALCVNIRPLTLAFKAYLLDKFQVNQKDLVIWEDAFADPTFFSAVVAFISQKVFEAKSELTLTGQECFATELGREYFIRQELSKNVRSYIHEAINRAIKYRGQDILTGGEIDAVVGALERKMDGKVVEIASMLRRGEPAEIANNALGIPNFDPYR